MYTVRTPPQTLLRKTFQIYYSMIMWSCVIFLFICHIEVINLASLARRQRVKNITHFELVFSGRWKEIAISLAVYFYTVYPINMHTVLLCFVSLWLCYRVIVELCEGRFPGSEAVLKDMGKWSCTLPHQTHESANAMYARQSKWNYSDLNSIPYFNRICIKDIDVNPPRHIARDTQLQ